MSNWNLGSVADECFILMDNIPTAISGTPLLRVVNRRLNHIETFLGQSIGSTTITDDYQEPLINLTMASLLRHSQIQGTDAKTIKIGEFTVDKGKGTSAETVSQNLEDQAMSQLRRIKGQYGYYRTF
jgi:hypothetical protein